MVEGFQRWQRTILSSVGGCHCSQQAVGCISSLWAKLNCDPLGPIECGRINVLGLPSPALRGLAASAFAFLEARCHVERSRLDCWRNCMTPEGPQLWWTFQLQLNSQPRGASHTTQSRNKTIPAELCPNAEMWTNKLLYFKVLILGVTCHAATGNQNRCFVVFLSLLTSGCSSHILDSIFAMTLHYPCHPPSSLTTMSTWPTCSGFSRMPPPQRSPPWSPG